MNYEELQCKTAAAVSQVSRMGEWDDVTVDYDGSEPVVYAVLRRSPVVQFLYKTGVLNPPKLPPRVRGVKCEIIVVNPKSR